MSLDNIYDEVVRRNRGEKEFHQAVREVLDSLEPVMKMHPEYTQARIIERLVEPDRQFHYLYDYTLF